MELLMNIIVLAFIAGGVIGLIMFFYKICKATMIPILHQKRSTPPKKGLLLFIFNHAVL